MPEFRDIVHKRQDAILYWARYLDTLDKQDRNDAVDYYRHKRGEFTHPPARLRTKVQLDVDQYFEEYGDVIS